MQSVKRAKKVRHGYGSGVTIVKKGRRVYLTGLEFMYGVHRAQGALDELELTSQQKKAAREGLKRKKITRQDLRRWV